MPNFQTGPKIATAGADVGGGTTTGGPWTNTQNVGAVNGSVATAVVTPLSTSNFLRVTGFGFQIPLAANVLGMFFSLQHFSAHVGLEPNAPPFTLQDAGVFIVQGGVAGNNDHSLPGYWPVQSQLGIFPPGTQVHYGSPTDTWGVNWSGAQINDNTGFGFQFAASNPSGITVGGYVTRVFGQVVYQVLQEGSGGGGGVGNPGPSYGGFIGVERVLLFPSSDLNFYTFDTTSFNDPHDVSTYSWRVEEIALARKPTVSRIFVTYRDLGVVTLSFTLTACDDSQKVVTNSTNVTLGNTIPTGALLTKEVDLMLSGMNMQLSMSRAAGAGPLSIAKIKMVGRVEMEAYT